MILKKQKAILTICFGIAIIVFSILFIFNKLENENNSNPIDDILVKGKLDAFILPNYYDYFLYNTEIKGANYEILSEYAKYLNVNLNIKTNPQNADIYILISNKEKNNIDSLFKIDKLEKTYSYNIINIDTNLNLTKDNFFIIGKNNFLMKNYFNKEIAFCEENLSKTLNNNKIKIQNQKNKIKTYVNFYVKKDKKELLESFSNWYSNFLENEKYKNIERKYFSQREKYFNFNNYYFSLRNQVISPYDKEIKTYCEKWDWRFISALIYEESHFNPNAVNPESGAFGLMQLLPYNMDLFDFDTSLNVEAQICSGVQLLNRIDKQINENIKDSETRNKVILSAYLIGLSHVLDAIALSEKYSSSEEYHWKSISYYLENLSNPDYYRDSVVKRGSCNCSYAVVYADKIYNRYLHYSNLVEK